MAGGFGIGMAGRQRELAGRNSAGLGTRRWSGDGLRDWTSGSGFTAGCKRGSGWRWHYANTMRWLEELAVRTWRKRDAC